MKILHITPTYIPSYRYGGPIYSVHGLCKSLAALGHEVHVYTTNVNGEEDSAVPIGQRVDLEGVKVWYFPSHFLRRLYYSPELEKHLKKTIRQFDIMHLHSVFLWPTLVGVAYARRYNIPYLLSPRGMLVKELVAQKSAFIKKLWIYLFERNHIAQAAALHLTSQSELNALQAFHLKLPACFVVANGIDVPSATTIRREDPFAKPDLPYMLLFLSRINWIKGLDRVIPAMQYIDNAYLRVVGNDEEDYLPTLEQLVASHSLEKKVFFHQAMYGETKKKLYQAATLFILPSYSENFGNVILEALSYGCPVIVTPEVGLSDFVKKHELGIVSAGDPEMLATNINVLLNDKEKRAHIQKTATKVIADHFSWQHIAQQMSAEYKKILQKK